MIGCRDVDWVKRESINGRYKHSSSLRDAEFLGKMNDSQRVSRCRPMELLSYENRIFECILQLIIKIVNDKNECFI
jgi:hypothetical protein